MKSSIAAASQRRQTRLRREYLYRKSLQGTEKQLYEKKRLIRNALACLSRESSWHPIERNDIGNGFGLFAGDAVIIMMQMIMRNAVLLVHDVNNV